MKQLSIAPVTGPVATSAVGPCRERFRAAAAPTWANPGGAPSDGTSRYEGPTGGIGFTHLGTNGRMAFLTIAHRRPPDAPT